MPGQRPTSGHQSGLGSVALTRRRLVVQGEGDPARRPRGADWLEVAFEAPDGLKLAYDAAAADRNRSGDVELRLQTPRAEEIHATLRKWMTA